MKCPSSGVQCSPFSVTDDFCVPCLNLRRVFVVFLSSACESGGLCGCTPVNGMVLEALRGPAPRVPCQPRKVRTKRTWGVLGVAGEWGARWNLTCPTASVCIMHGVLCGIVSARTYVSRELRGKEVWLRRVRCSGGRVGMRCVRRHKSLLLFGVWRIDALSAELCTRETVDPQVQKFRGHYVLPGLHQSCILFEHFFTQHTSLYTAHLTTPGSGLPRTEWCAE